MIKIATRYLQVFVWLSIILCADSYSQNRLITRNSQDIPETFQKTVQTEHRKLINLNGQWDFSSDKNNASNVTVPFCYDFKGKVSVSRMFNTGIEHPNEWNYIILCEGIN